MTITTRYYPEGANVNKESCREFPPMSRRSLSQAIFGGSLGFVAASQSAGARENVRDASLLDGGSVEDHLSIEQLLYRYARALDTLDVAMMAECFAPQGVLWGPGFDLRGDFAGLIEEHRKAELTMHQVMNHSYAVRGSTATGVTYGIYTWIIIRDGERLRSDGHNLYHDELIKQGSRWQFLKRRFEPLFRTEMPVESFYADVTSRRKS